MVSNPNSISMTFLQVKWRWKKASFMKHRSGKLNLAENRRELAKKVLDLFHLLIELFH